MIPGAVHSFMIANVPLRPLDAFHVPDSRVGDDGAEKVTIVPVQSEPRAVNWSAATPQSPLTAQ